MLELLIALVILTAVAAWVLRPLRRRAGTGEERVEDPVLAELEARKQAKYGEIRDTEQDHAQGKLTEAEYVQQDAELRREAIAILKEIDAASARPSPDPSSGE